MKVQDVCAAGDAEAREKVKYTETGAFFGGVAGGAVAGGVLGSGIASGVATGGTGALVCGAAVIGGASLIAGISMEKGVEKLAEKIYEMSR